MICETNSTPKLLILQERREFPRLITWSVNKELYVHCMCIHCALGSRFFYFLFLFVQHIQVQEFDAFQS